jgi:hypothetical protein
VIGQLLVKLEEIARSAEQIERNASRERVRGLRRGGLGGLDEYPIAALAVLALKRKNPEEGWANLRSGVSPLAGRQGQLSNCDPHDCCLTEDSARANAIGR